MTKNLLTLRTPSPLDTEAVWHCAWFPILCLFSLPLLAEEVAVMTNVSANNSSHHALAAGMIDASRHRLVMSDRPLAEFESRPCVGDQECLRRAARKTGASHLLVQGVAFISDEETVVSMQLLDLESGLTIAEKSEIIMVVGDSYAFGKAFSERFLDGLQPSEHGFFLVREATEVSQKEKLPKSYRTSAMGWAGWGLVAIAGFFALGALGFGLADAADSTDRIPLPHRAAVAASSWAPIWASLGVGLSLAGFDFFSNYSSEDDISVQAERTITAPDSVVRKD